MSSLKERLSRLKKSGDGADGAAAGTADTAPVTSREAEADTKGPGETLALGPAWERLGAAAQDNDRGSFVIRRRRYALDYAHGTYRLGELCGTAHRLEALAATGGKRGSRTGRAGDAARSGGGTIPSVRHDRLLFLDTETTGLGIGAGNVAFMVGIGFYESDAFVVEQLFIRNPAEEAAMLHHLRERLAERDMLVSYNGKSFDWPILKNRYVLNRQKEGAADPVHFDFLYPSRSLWRNTLPSCRLSSVERERLGLTRIDDVPGSLAPALYFQYLAEGDPVLLAGVFEHNEKDVLTLACLAVHFSKLLDEGLPSGSAAMEAEEVYRHALWLDKLGRAELADEAYRELLGREPDESADYWLPAADYYKRNGLYGPAVALWERLVERKRRARVAPVEPYIELAMYYEHQLKDFDQALRYAEQALERARGRLSAVRQERAAAELDAIRKRIDRLRAKRDAAGNSADGGRRAMASAPMASTDVGRSAGRPKAAPNGRGRRTKAERAPAVWQETLL
ncbi:ribonuclease H-like domain-containing protein [Paenibacillus flagellatus]|uniref:YprB ribonuclease H-like domain-containing protein n=1 Tax=Paenibacillus flagellatus TaxID=2211139 RepID=A0A2V5KLI4_9BACL|nr:ribonuclease H-like domain-containing protein [Paenibacillus flagellatus]PYI55890.1 hypothetical protein DLM86_09265 [Paenibacillus flagellatus]